jgi:hypothetical protein
LDPVWRGIDESHPVITGGSFWQHRESSNNSVFTQPGTTF